MKRMTSCIAGLALLSSTACGLSLVRLDTRSEAAWRRVPTASGVPIAPSVPRAGKLDCSRYTAYSAGAVAGAIGVGGGAIAGGIWAVTYKEPPCATYSSCELHGLGEFFAKFLGTLLIADGVLVGSMLGYQAVIDARLAARCREIMKREQAASTAPAPITPAGSLTQ